jgi:hypothetical protein
MSVDPFTTRRLVRFVETFRAREGHLPTLADFAREGFAEDVVDAAVRAGILERLYVTLTSGSVVKGYKVGPSV